MVNFKFFESEGESLRWMRNQSGTLGLPTAREF